MAKFCSNCGKPLEEDEVCNCTQQPENTQQEVNQEQQTAEETVQTQQAVVEPQQTTQEAGSQITNAQNANKVVEEMKEGFLSLLSIVKKPVTETKKLAEKSSVVTGIAFMAVKTVIALLVVLIALRDTLSYLPVGTLVFGILLWTIGVDCAEAALLKVFSGVFKVQTKMKSMFTIGGIKAICEAAIILVVGIISIISGSLAMTILVAGFAAVPAIQYAAYNETTGGDVDNKIFGYIVVKAIAAVIAILVIYLFAQSLVSGLLGGIIGYGGFGF